MSTWQLGAGSITATERELIAVPNGGGRGRPAVLMPHGAGATSRDYVYDVAARRQVELLLQAGLVVCAPDLLGDNWGVEAAAQLLDQYRPLLAQRHGTDAERIALAPTSMGDLTAMTYLRLFPQRVACIGGVMPAADTDDIRDRNTFGVERAQIDARWGVTHPAPLPAYANPLREPALSALAATDVPVRLWYSEGDRVTRPQFVRQLATALGGTAVKVSELLDHSTALALAVPAQDYVRFFDAHTRRAP